MVVVAVTVVVIELVDSGIVLLLVLIVVVPATSDKCSESRLQTSIWLPQLSHKTNAGKVSQS